MVRSEKSGRDRDAPTAPPDTATPPPAISADYSFTLQAVMEMQKTLGKVENAVETLITEIREIKAKVTRFDKVLAIAGVLGAVGLAILIWVANVAKDVGMLYMKGVVEQPRAVSPVSPSPPSITPPATPQK